MIQLHRLEGFYRVATARGYARAARAFPYPITQPAVHQQVRKLEQELGVKLLERVGKDRVEPTSAGRVLLDFCAPFFEGLPATVRAISERSYGGVLRIDAAAMEIQHVIPPWIARLRQRRPDIHVDLEEVAFADPARLLRGDADIVVDYQPTVAPELEGRQVATYRAVLVAKRGPRRPALRALRNHAFVGFHPSLPQHDLQMAGLRQAGYTPRRSLSASSVSAILSLVQAGLGYSVVPWPLGHLPELSDVVAVPLRGSGTRFPIIAAWRRRTPPDPLIEAAIEAL